MEIKTIDECFKFRLLRKIQPDKEKSKKSFEIAKERIKMAEQMLRLKVYHYVILEAYMAMFHSARALLYKEGMQEKSHYAIYIYLKEKYSNQIPFNIINYLNIHRTQRHEAIYGLDFEPKEEDAALAIKDAKTFLDEIKKVLGETKETTK